MQEPRPNWILGSRQGVDRREFSSQSAVSDHKIQFILSHCHKKDVLDLGCVQHNPENHNSRFWLHKALFSVAASVEGLDIYAEGVRYLRDFGYEIHLGDAQNFDLKRDYDVIIAGDLIEHLEDLDGFFVSCLRHLRPTGELLISTPNPWYWRNIVKAVVWCRVANNPEHTLWMDPVTLSQLASRHGMKIVECRYGSRYLRDRLMPLPKGIKHTSFHVVLIRTTLHQGEEK